ncbi:hypothetical protein [Gandjariella thermophila]|uniref:Uncharacterized protein n=1 Tax=Gandjariella thermophila TaxID=1931992 RepID=A0A4D4J591_9PSEU|nr:hypothetical protein [Gandjariella thermophila]GDY29147.1 hypothetical protein GTS_07800 [Gandjariella thermophila]
MDPCLVAEVRRQGHKIRPQGVVRIGRNVDGHIRWLEKDIPNAGVGHIMNPKRVDEFARVGVAESDIVDLVFHAATHGTPIGISGKDRTVFETVYRGRRQRVAVTISSNGFIVGANPVSPDRKLKPLP